MKNKKIVKMFSVILALIICVGNQGGWEVCAATSKTPAMQKKLTIKKGKKKTLKVKGKYIKSCKFSSTKKAVASVSKKGKVLAKKAGTCTIKAVVRYKKKPKAKKQFKKVLKCRVTVKPDGSENTEIKDPDLPALPDNFVKQNAEFSVNLAKESMSEAIQKGDNVLISPASVIHCLALVLGGANGKTQEQLKETLCGDADVTEFQKNLSEYSSYLKNSQSIKFHLANSIWIRQNDNLAVKEDYLQRMNEYYGTSVFKRVFDESTVKEINQWVDNNTAHMIPGIIEKISPNDMFYLINALSFEGQWQSVYRESDVHQGENFTNAKGENESVTMLHKTEYAYVEDEKATGIIKPYKGERYAFMGILPKSGVTLQEYVGGMTGAGLLNLYETRHYEEVKTEIPEFSYDYSASLVKPVKAMGITDLFDKEKADLSNLASVGQETLYVDDVIHKTHIELDRNGTRAGAVTAVKLKATSMAPSKNPKEVYFDRPFLYAVVDTNSGLPVFVGVVNSVTSK